MEVLDALTPSKSNEPIALYPPSNLF